jgi:hypothetical protein
VSSWNLHINLYELILEKECLIRCIDQRLASPSALEPESKWISFEIEVDHVKSELLLALLLGYDIVRNIEAICAFDLVCERKNSTFVACLSKGILDPFEEVIVDTARVGNVMRVDSCNLTIFDHEALLGLLELLHGWE